MKKLLTIAIEITGEQRVKGTSGEVAMIFFTGSASGAYFCGTVSGTGTDTQKEINGKRTLSARYMLKGTDYTGAGCSIFIENNAELRNTDPGASFETVPVLLTDSAQLAWMERELLTGRLVPEKNGPVIEIYGE